MRKNHGFTLVELLIVVALIGILAALSAHHLMAAKAAANEASAIATLRALNSAQSTFAASCGSGMYATTFATLVTGRFASADMNINPKSGYNFTLSLGNGGSAAADGCEGTATQTAYYASGTPLTSLAGQRAFATSQGGTIWENLAGIAPAEPFAMTGTIAPLQRAH